MKYVKLFEQFISEKKSKADYEDIIDKYESKIWELDNANASWIPTDSSKKEKMRQTFQKKIDAAQKALDKLDEALVNEARAPKTVDELKSALDDAYEKMNKYNEKYYSINRAPGGGSWSSNSKEGKAAAKYKKMANNQQANIWKWTDKLRKLGVEYNSTNEALVSEKSGDSYSSGCVMLYFDFPQMNKIHDGIDSNDLYEEEGDRTFGLEDEPHCTLLYGLEDSVTVEQVKEILDQHTFGTCKVHNASLFENDYDVLKFDVKGDSLHACNRALCELPYHSNYPDYHPHMTVAYLKKGMGRKYCDRMRGYEYDLVPTHAVFSQPDGTKNKIKINID